MKKKKSVRKICTKYTTNQLEKQTTVQSHRSTNQRHSWTIVLPSIGQQARLSAKKKNENKLEEEVPRFAFSKETKEDFSGKQENKSTRAKTNL